MSHKTKDLDILKEEYKESLKHGETCNKDQCGACKVAGKLSSIIKTIEFLETKEVEYSRWARMFYFPCGLEFSARSNKWKRKGKGIWYRSKGIEDFYTRFLSSHLKEV